MEEATRRGILAADRIPLLPCRFGPPADPVPDLAGWEVVGIGTLPRGFAVEGGGLVLDVRRGDVLRRVVLGHTELGAWLELDDTRPAGVNP